MWDLNTTMESIDHIQFLVECYNIFLGYYEYILTMAKTKIQIFNFWPFP